MHIALNQMGGARIPKGFDTELRCEPMCLTQSYGVNLKKGKVVDLTPTLTLSAAKLSLSHNLAMDDSIMFATAKAYEATLWTLDSDFKDIPDVNYYSKSEN